MGCGSSSDSKVTDAAKAAPAAAGKDGADAAATKKKSKSKHVIAADVLPLSKLKDTHKTNVIWDDYEMKRVIGEGGFGRVVIAERKSDKEQFAIKVQEIMCKKLTDRKCTDTIGVFDDEVSLLKLIHHPYIGMCIDSYICDGVKKMEDGKDADVVECCMVLELCQGPELFDAVLDHGQYSEKTAVEFFRTILSAVKHLHANNVLHLDIKPENFVFSKPLDKDEKKVYEDEDDRPRIKLIDFGVAAKVVPPETFEIRFFSMQYSAPEVLVAANHRFTCDELKANDMWAVGCVLYIMLTCCLPFEGNNSDEMMEDIKSGLRFPEDVELSRGVMDLLYKLLETDPKKRITATEAFQHPWLTSEEHSVKALLKPGLTEGLIQIGRASKLKRAMAEFILLKNIDLSNTAKMIKKFQSADVDKSGYLDISETAAFIQKEAVKDSAGEGVHNEEVLKKEAEEIVRAADTDQSGQVDVNEFARVLQMAELSNNDHLLETVFERLDADKSGFISQKELDEAFSGLSLGELLNDDVFKKAISELAAEPDKLSLAEFKVAMSGKPTVKRKKTKREEGDSAGSGEAE